MTRPFHKVLVANRGEIAVRVLSSAAELGYLTVAVFSTADADAPHVHLADQAVDIGPAPADRSYLSADSILSAAADSGADAIHPGYGFLSENADFAAACLEAGLVFVGPSPECIRAMGDKRAAKARMAEAGVPCIPGYAGADQSPEVFRRAADDIGYPVMIKATAGGGGRGIRIVQDADTLDAAIRSAASEAANAFGDGTLYLEKVLADARHVEVQVMADAHGTVLHLGERDCSAQRRNQKVVEETPSPNLSSGARARICEDAVTAATAIGYCGAGTVEFLVDDKGQHFFLEMNTRLQVEHPVTEMVTGLDLVALQFRVAAGERLGLAQDDIVFRGAAIEARLYAEDPSEGFLPQTGRIELWRPASGPNIRVDSGIATGQTVSPHYDAMVAKLIAWGETRAEARRRLEKALNETVLSGIRSNRSYLVILLRDRRFVEGRITTAYLDNQPALAEGSIAAPMVIALGALRLCWPPEMSVAEWCRAGPGAWRVDLAESDVSVTVERDRDGAVRLSHGDSTENLVPLSLIDATLRFRRGTIIERVLFLRIRDTVEIGLGADRVVLTERRDAGLARDREADGKLRAPMAGLVREIRVAAGEPVTENRTVLLMEAMKMELEVRAPRAGILARLNVKAGAHVAAGDLLAEIEVEEGDDV